VAVRTWSIIAAALLLATSCAHRAPAVAQSGQFAQLQQRQAAFLGALAARDVDATAASFADDAVLHVAGMPAIVGRSAIHGFYGNVFRFMAASEAVPETLRLSDGGDMAWSTGRVANSFQSEQGLTHFAGKYVLVWERRGGDWAIVLYGISSNQADPAR
jgi:ketosteroid isomerase-like protein